MKNREIKFRAWDKTENNWLEAVTYTLHTSGRLITLPPDIELMQYTGLKDKNGVEIYEGDILRMGYGDGSTHEMPSVVKFGVHQVGFDSDAATTGPALGFYFSPYPYGGDGIGIGEHFNWEDPEYYEVIGNIYEHAHLLPNTAS